ncbi:MAG: hypothetical protein QF473_20920 [Planctomycetota bacterium]|jgi:hypothetical protein|nr:hypothetical protein [Planctomycetota bacterium]MDP6506264.1 hypothetical protein [Planctomycetota bacterium]
MTDSKYAAAFLVLLITGCETPDVRDLSPGTVFAKFALTFDS